LRHPDLEAAQKLFSEMRRLVNQLESVLNECKEGKAKWNDPPLELRKAVTSFMKDSPSSRMAAKQNSELLNTAQIICSLREAGAAEDWDSVEEQVDLALGANLNERPEVIAAMREIEHQEQLREAREKDLASKKALEETDARLKAQQSALLEGQKEFQELQQRLKETSEAGERTRLEQEELKRQLAQVHAREQEAKAAEEREKEAKRNMEKQLGDQTAKQKGLEADIDRLRQDAAKARAHEQQVLDELKRVENLQGDADKRHNEEIAKLLEDQKRSTAAAERALQDQIAKQQKQLETQISALKQQGESASEADKRRLDALQDQLERMKQQVTADGNTTLRKSLQEQRE
jgi:chromosome segregation ATPase